MARPLPIPDPVSRFFWEGAARGSLLIQRCGSCLCFQYPPTVVCESCQSRDVIPTEVSGRGSIFALTVVHQAFLPDFSEDVPYTLVLVELDDAPGVRLLTNLVDQRGQTSLACDAVEVTFEMREGVAIPQFRPAREVLT